MPMSRTASRCCLGLLKLSTLAALWLLPGCSRQSSPEQPAVREQTTPAAVAPLRIVLEAEQAMGIAAPWQQQRDPLAGAGAALGLGAVATPELAAVPALHYTLTLERQALAAIWVRARWQDGCGNSVALQVDGRPPVTVGNDSTYGSWHWVRAPQQQLAAGERRLILRAREPNIAIDQILITTDATPPAGATPATANPAEPRVQADAELPALDLPLLPQPAAGGRVPTIGVGGSYGIGWEPVLVAWGLPYTRLHDYQLRDRALLKRFDVLLVTQHPRDAVTSLLAYVEAGGSLVTETSSFGYGYGYGRGRNVLEQIANVPPLNIASSYRRQRVHPCKLFADESPLLASISDGDTLAYGLTVQRLAAPRPTWRAHGRGETLGQEAPLIVEGEIGEGRVFYAGVNFGFSGIRGDRYAPVARALLRAALGVEQPTPLATVSWQLDGSEVVYQRDDFMRTPAEAHSWHQLTGDWQLTGADDPHPFVFRGHAAAGESARCATSDTPWPEPLIGAAVRVGESTGAGVWLRTSSGAGAEALLTVDGLVLRSLDGEQPGTTLARAAAAGGPAGGWRFLSLQCAGSRWVATLDGAQQLAAPAATADSLHAGLVVSRGRADFDDVAVGDRRALLPGQDRWIGSEGAARAVARRPQSLEARTVYSPLYDLSITAGAPGDGLALHLALPTFGETLVLVDGAPVGRAAPATAGPRFVLPATTQPSRALEARVIGCRDYSFTAQLVDWYATGKAWKRESRWACDPSWQWLGVRTESPSILWYRTALKPPYAMRFLAAPAQRDGGNRQLHPVEEGRDMNLVFDGNGVDLSAGVVFRILPPGGGAVLLRDGVEIARAPEFRPYVGQKLHHLWVQLTALVEPQQVSIFHDGALVLRAPVARPIGPGRCGFWTERAGMQLARATVLTLPSTSQDSR
jgi:hypothetical protein